MHVPMCPLQDRYYRHYSLSGKLSCLLSFLLDGVVPPGDSAQVVQELKRESPLFARVATEVERFTGMELRLCGDPVEAATHPFRPPLTCLPSQLPRTVPDVRKYLFGATSYAETHVSTQPRPWEIQTDRGTDLAWDDRLRGIPPTHETLQLVLDRERRLVRLPQGEEFKYPERGGAVDPRLAELLDVVIVTDVSCEVNPDPEILIEDYIIQQLATFAEKGFLFSKALSVNRTDAPAGREDRDCELQLTVKVDPVRWQEILHPSTRTRAVPHTGY